MRYLLHKDWAVIERRIAELRKEGFTQTDQKPGYGQFRVRQSDSTHVWKLEAQPPPRRDPAKPYVASDTMMELL